VSQDQEPKVIEGQLMSPVSVAPHMRVVGSDHLNAMSVEAVKGRVQRVQEVMKAVMKEGVHYGKIVAESSSMKPSLWKPGAEVLAMTFGLAPMIQSVVTGDHPDIEFPYTSRKKEWFNGAKGREFRWVEEKGVCKGYFEVVSTCEIHSADGRVLARATGSCNNRENKYRTTAVYDTRNTVRKMAEKRAFIAAMLMATAASDMFTQDVEDGDEEEHGQTGTQQTQGGGEKSSNMSEAQRRMVWGRAKFAGMSEAVSKLALHYYDQQPVKDIRSFLDRIGAKDATPEQVATHFKPFVEEAAKQAAAPADPAV
jgi:hypothetical protein